MGKGDEYAGYYCLMIAIFCNVSADEAWLMYWHEPKNPVCQRIMKKRSDSASTYETKIQKRIPTYRKEETDGRL